MNYNFVELGSSEYNTLSKETPELVRGILINPIPEILNNIADKPNVIKIAKSVARMPNQTQEDVWFIPKQDVTDGGYPYWLFDKVSYGTLHEHHQNPNLAHLLQKRTVPTTSIQEVFETNNVEKVGILSLYSVDKDTEILLNALPYLSTKQDKPAQIRFSIERILPNKIDEVITAYSTIGYSLKLNDGNFVTLQHSS